MYTSQATAPRYMKGLSMCNVALSVTPGRDTSPKGRGKGIYEGCGNNGKNTRRCGGTLFTKEGLGA